jgi:hypothetical protein
LQNPVGFVQVFAVSQAKALFRRYPGRLRMGLNGVYLPVCMNRIFRYQSKEKTMVKKNLQGMLVMVLVFGMTVVGCSTLGLGKPKSFQKGSGGDTTILLRQGLDYDQAFREVDFAIRKHNFEVETLTPEVGYLRTQWSYAWNGTGKTFEAYRVRIICNFNPGRTQLIFKAEAQYLEGENWVQGFDTSAIEALRVDLTNAVGN